MNKNIMIMSNSGKNIFSGGFFQEISAGDRAIFGSSGNGSSYQIARYDTAEQCAYALGMLWTAMIADEEFFEFPHKKDIDNMMMVARQYHSKATNRKVSHGGS